MPSHRGQYPPAQKSAYLVLHKKTGKACPYTCPVTGLGAANRAMRYLRLHGVCMETHRWGRYYFRARPPMLPRCQLSQPYVDILQEVRGGAVETRQVVARLHRDYTLTTSQIRFLREWGYLEITSKGSRGRYTHALTKYGKIVLKQQARL